MSLTFSIAELKQNPDEYTKNVSIMMLGVFIRRANKYYYETEKQIVPDAIYDIALDNLRLRSPNNPILTEIGFTPSDEKVELPYHMGSMTKFKTKDGIATWLGKYEGPFVISDKLDGASAVLDHKDGQITLFSRGNGTLGRDITHLLKYMMIPKLKSPIALRGELIISKDKFANHLNIYSNSRSMVVGLMGKKTLVPELINLIDFVVFEIINDTMNSHNQLQLAQKMGFKTCNYSLYPKKNLTYYGPPDATDMKESFLLKTLINHRQNALYDIDGIIITDNGNHLRNMAGNPKYSIAFKANGIGKIVKVVNVDWNVSKHGKIVPRIEIEPVVIDGVKIQFATGYHAKFIVDNAIGVESLVRIVRSGDVIPSIIEVIQKSKEPIMPSSVEYEWNETRVNIFVKNADTNDAYTHQQLLHFYRTMGVENVSVALIKRFIANGYDTIAKIYNISKNELLEMDGIQQTMADKIYENIHNSIDKPLPLEKIMAASLKFGNGFGIRRLKLIVNTYPDIMTTDTINISAITNIDGFSTITATQFIAALPEFKTFMTEHPFLIIGDSKNPIKKGKFSGKKILFTGFRDAKIKEYIEKNGGTIANAINKNLDILLIKNADATGSKIMKAKELGIKIMTKDELLI